MSKDQAETLRSIMERSPGSLKALPRVREWASYGLGEACLNWSTHVDDAWLRNFLSDLKPHFGRLGLELRPIPDSSGDLEILYVSPRGNHWMVAVLQAQQILSNFPNKRLGVISMDTSEGSEGWKAFKSLVRYCGQRVDTQQIHYLGHFPSVTSGRFLLKLDEASMKDRCLELIAKRIIAMVIEGEE